MDNYIFLNKYFYLLQGVMFDSLIDLDCALIGVSFTDKTFYWNQALVNRLLNQDEFLKVVECMKNLNRTPTFYFESREDLSPLIKFLMEKGCLKSFEDSWMFFNNEVLTEKGFEKVQKVNSENDLKVFLKTLNDCYQKNDHQNPYGELGDYLKVVENIWHKHHTTNRIEYFIVYKDSNPVAVSSLNNHNEIGYISNVGSLKIVRGEGFGKIATLYCVKQSKLSGNKIHCLATEEGNYPNNFYKRIGFKTYFTAEAYTLK